jgi:hypothetical protein
MPEQDEEQLQRLFADLETMADYKYNRYEMYQPGRLFLENLYLWLLGLDLDERRAALQFVRERLIFVSREEFQQLAHVLYHDHIRQRQLDTAAATLRVPRHCVRLVSDSEEFRRVQRASLYVAMSDGARIDYFRRQNLEINNEQVLATYQPSADKVRDLTKELIRVQGSEAKFQCLFLLDDFCGSGRTLLREVVRADLAKRLPDLNIPTELSAYLKYDDERRTLEFGYSDPAMAVADEIRRISDDPVYREAIDDIFCRAAARKTDVKGSLKRLLDDSGLGAALAPNASVYFCPLLTTEYAITRLQQLVPRLATPMDRLQVLPGAVIPNTMRILEGGGPIADICERHYDAAALQDRHTGSVKFGYDHCGLPVVLHHNTPNNSLYILWARKWKDPLFVRYERHGREGV